MSATAPPARRGASWYPDDSLAERRGEYYIRTKARQTHTFSGTLADAVAVTCYTAKDRDFVLHCVRQILATPTPPKPSPSTDVLARAILSDVLNLAKDARHEDVRAAARGLAQAMERHLERDVGASKRGA